MIPAPEPHGTGLATSADGSRIAWRRYGDGEARVLFVPTWNLVDSRVVGHQVAALAPHATVVTYDARGSGASERPPRGYGFPLHAADARAVLDAVGLDRVAIVTASRGVNAGRAARDGRAPPRGADRRDCAVHAARRARAVPCEAARELAARLARLHRSAR